VEVAAGQTPLDALAVDLGDQRQAVVHGDRQWLGATHAAQARGHDQLAVERAAEVLAGELRERFESALQDALGADIDPRASGHLAVHRQSQPFETPKLLIRSPGWYEQ